MSASAAPAGPAATAPPERARLSIAVAGAGGRMGRMLVQAVLDAPDLRLSGALDRAGSAAVGTDAGAFAGLASGVTVTADIDAGLDGADVLIDFTQPQGTLAHLAACRARGVRAVIGTTGFDTAGREAVAQHARDCAVVLSANMSVGVNVMLVLLAQAARLLDASYDIEVVETHHRHKVDAPSGTALAIGEVLASARGVELPRDGVFARHGHTGERAPGSIGFAALRGGDIVGDHVVMFAGSGERLEIAHRSGSRANYADGSLRAARFVAGRTSGLYGMDDVLGLRR